MDIVYLSNQGNPVTDTLKVANAIKRRHSNITKSVRRIMAQTSGVCFYETKYNANGHTLPMYVMNRQGFEVLTRTIPQIGEWRIGVLEEFDRIIGKSPKEHAQSEYAPDITPYRLSKPKLIPAVEEYAKSKIELAIPVNQEKRAVNARDLWQWLESGQQFTDWMASRIERCDLIEGVDYQVFHGTMKKDSTSGGRPSTEYALSIDAAKECAMIEGNEKGKAARRYFIECEKQFRYVVESGLVQGLPTNFADALRQLANQVESNERLENEKKQLTAKIEKDAPKVAFAESIITSNAAIHIGELAKVICQNGVETGEIRLFKWMRENGFLCSASDARNQPTQKALEMGLFEIKRQVVELPSGETINTATTLVTGKGQMYFVNKFLYNQQKQKEVNQ